jgi:hypothetical protein
MTTFVDEIDELINLHLVNLGGLAVTLGDGPRVVDDFGNTAYGVAVTNQLTLHSPYFGFLYLAGASFADTIKFSQVFASQSKLNVVVPQGFKLSTTTGFGRQITLTFTQAMTLGSAVRVIVATSLVQRLVFKDSNQVTAKFTAGVMDALKLHDLLLKFLGGSFSDTVILSGSAAPTFAFNRLLGENVALHDALTGSLLWQATYADGLDLDDATLVSMIFDGQLGDIFALSAGWLDPSGGWTSWAINTRTQNVTEYQGLWSQGFQSIAKLGSQYVAANNQGLWALDGPTDNGANIATSMKSGILDLGDSHFTQLDAIYIGVRTKDNAKEFLLKLHTRSGIYVYQFRPKDMASTKINVGKGFRHRYFAWELVAPGPDFDLESIVFLPVISKRRAN